MSRETMIEYIQEKMKLASDRDVEIVYGLVLGLVRDAKRN